MSLSKFFRRASWDDERARELETYLQMETDENVARGMSADAARAAAQRRLGNVTRIREDIYDMNTIAWIDSIWHDLRYGARLLRVNPGFALVAILSLALGVGANTAIFQLIDAVRLRLLPVEAPDRLVEVRIIDTNDEGRTGEFLGNRSNLTYPLVEQIRREQQAFSGLAVWGSTTFNLADGGEVRNAAGLWVSGDFFPTLGVHPFIGRLLTASDDVRGCSAAAVISYAFWQQEFGGDPGAVGRTLSLDGHQVPIVGVTSPRFFGVDVGRSFDVAAPICAESLENPRKHMDQPDVWWLAAFGRLKPGWTIDRANAQIAAAAPNMLRATVSPRYTPHDAAAYLKFKIGVEPAATGVSNLRRDYATPLWVLLATTALVLLIACANLANLMLARATARERELAVRLAIGASRSRIVRQLLAESVLIATIGGALGAAVAVWLSRLLVGFLTTGRNQLFLDMRLDWRVFAFTASLAFITAVLFGLAPAVRVTRTPPADAMKSGGRGTIGSRERFGLRRSLVIAQVALSLVLVVGALLFVRTLRNLADVDTGFDAKGVVAVEVDMRRASIPEGRRLALFQEMADRIAAIPGVEGSALATIIPMSGGGWNDRVIIDGVLTDGATNFNRVSPGYFKTLRTRLIAGRDIDRRDQAGGPLVAVVTETFVRKHLKGASAIGRTFQLDAPPGEPRPPYTIVGVVQDSKYQTLRDPYDPLVYLASAQNPETPSQARFVVRADGVLPRVTAAITGIVRSTNPAAAVEYLTMETIIQDGLMGERLMATLSGFFGGLAAIIAMIGLYGVLSYMVQRRRSEIGIRMALGADRGEVVRMILREAAVLAAVGLVIGVVLSAALGRAAASLLYELKPWDPSTLMAALAGLGAVAVVAAYVPARQASRVEPTVALRTE